MSVAISGDPPPANEAAGLREWAALLERDDDVGSSAADDNGGMLGAPSSRSLSS
jgi:hypothetical protein